MVSGIAWPCDHAFTERHAAMTLALDRVRRPVHRDIDRRLLALLLVLAAVGGTLAVVLAHAPGFEVMTHLYLVD